MSEDRTTAAQVEVDRTRARLLASLREVSRQFEPHQLMQEAWDKAKEKGADLAEDAVDAVRARPIAATGVIAAITMFLAREPLMDLAGRVVGAKAKSRKRPNPAKKQDKEPAE